MKKPTNAMSLKALVKNIAKEKNISAQLVLQNYVLERLLVRIAASRYKDNFILKGGLLISAMLGLDTRTTMDIDTTIKGFTLSEENLISIFNEVCNIDVNDSFYYEMDRIEEIRESDEYGGYRIYLKAVYEPLKVPLSVDITTGDKITPKEMNFPFKLMFDEGSINILSYNVETILAEKIETILSRSVANRRIRDYYDIYILWKFYANKVNVATLTQALRQTSVKRGTYEVIENHNKILADINNDKMISDLWIKYAENYEYAKEITYDDIFVVLTEIMDKIF